MEGNVSLADIAAVTDKNNCNDLDLVPRDFGFSLY